MLEDLWSPAFGYLEGPDYLTLMFQKILDIVHR